MVSREDAKLKIMELILEEKYNEALKELMSVLQKEPSNTQLKMLLFDIYFNLGNEKRAVDIAAEISQQLIKDGFFDTAIGYLKKAIFYTKNPKLYRILFRALIKRNLTYEAFNTMLDFCEYAIKEKKYLKEAKEFLDIVEDLSPIPSLTEKAKELKEKLSKTES